MTIHVMNPFNHTPLTAEQLKRDCLSFMSIDQIASEILQLSPHDRAILAETIWESLEEPYLFSTDISEKQAIKLAKQRDAEIEQGKVKPLSHKELMHRLHK